MPRRRLLRCSSVILVLSLGLTGCVQEIHDPPASVSQYPHATDRLVRLIAKELTDTTYETLKPDAKMVDCELERLMDGFGIGEGMARAKAVKDSVKRHDPDRWDRLNRLLSGHTETVPGCIGVNAAADSTDPLPQWPHK